MHWQPSFFVPLQLSSLPETQVSAAVGAMLHAPQTPLVQVSVPAAQLPSLPSAAHDRVVAFVQAAVPPVPPVAPPAPPRPAPPPVPLVPPVAPPLPPTEPPLPPTE